MVPNPGAQKMIPALGRPLDFASSFRHASLEEDSKQIRLTRIKPAANKEDLLHLELKVVDLDSYPQLFRGRERLGADRALDASDDKNSAFTALSYAWGPEAPCYNIRIECDHHHGCMSIRQNLYEFLETIRDCSTPSGWFWIDQICIDQMNDQEKGHQVNQMSEVYTNASRVEAWLGPAFERSDWIFGAVSRSLRSRPITNSWPTEVMMMLSETLARFSTLPYWSRLWVVQEITLNDNTTLRLGAETIRWDASFRSGCRELCLDLMSDWKLMSDRKFISEPSQLPIYTFLTARTDLDADWSSVWALAVGKNCSQDKDKAFGLMALLPKRLRFYPDYNMSLTDVLLAILDRTVSAQLDAGSKGSAPYGLEHVALGWYRVLDPHHCEIRPDLVRKDLLHKAHPALRTLPRTTIPYYPVTRFLCERVRKLQDQLLRVKYGRNIPFVVWQAVTSFDSLADRLVTALTPPNSPTTVESAVALQVLSYMDALFSGVGSRPACLLQYTLWWMFPEQKSRRWRSTYLHYRGIQKRLTPLHSLPSI